MTEPPTHPAPDGAMAEQPAQRAHEELVRFYDDSYSRGGERGMLYARWRALGAVGKAEHVIELCSRACLRPRSTLDVGCGDGALLSELGTRGFGGALHGVEITQQAVDIAAGRPGIEWVRLYDGRRLPCGEREHELGIVSHVLEHVPDPVELLAEVARACAAVVVEVPLEDNVSARRSGKRAHADEVGHLQRLSRPSMRAIAQRAGLRVVGELEDPLPLQVHLFFAQGRLARGAAAAKWAARSTLHRLAPMLARRLFTLHYACLCLPPDVALEQGGAPAGRARQAHLGLPIFR